MAHLIVLPASGEPFTASLGDGETVIGSSATATVRIADPALAACHAVIHRTDGSFVIARHAMPFLVNGLKARQHVLAPFDLVSLGQTAISFRHGEAPARASDSSAALELCRRLNDFTRRVADGADQADLTRVLLEDVVRLTSASQGALVLFGEDDARAVALAEGRRGEFTAEDASFSRTLVARMRDAGKPLLVTDLAGDADLAMAPSLQRSSTRAVICAPVVLDERIIGALYVGTSRAFSRAELELLTLYAHHAVHIVAAAQRDRTLTAELARVERHPESSLIGSSAAMVAVATQIRKVASHDIGVLIVGETGTGKEVVAREVHRLGAGGPFVAVDCGAIAEGLFESEMFGHKKGAFTHAYQDRAGFIRRAHGGTLFLDEVGELPLAHQAKLLRVLQERVVTPVGGENSHEVEFRLLCATNRDLDKEVNEGRFRRDLFYRIAAVTIALPPLRERDEDVIALAHCFLRRHKEALGRSELRFSAAALTAMRQYRWPGNVRELEAAVRKAVVLCESDAIAPLDLGIGAETTAEILPLSVVRDRHLKHYVRQVVDRLAGDRAEAAKQLMVSVRTVFKYMEEV